jgi:hypothetical protein
MQCVDWHPSTWQMAVFFVCRLSSVGLTLTATPPPHPPPWWLVVPRAGPRGSRPQSVAPVPPLACPDLRFFVIYKL